MPRFVSGFLSGVALGLLALAALSPALPRPVAGLAADRPAPEEPPTAARTTPPGPSMARIPPGGALGD
ncbi:hypothetical protein [Rubellimicrobium aerolatum]|uniref:Uncharacterized protein n=1 Tax=Rubellimicrobium aerolatum TaxID=490979 RepID=A0ABW0SBQ0_9RHOB|nr:hypothetical protein [Rubellimicrobium aerolatum]MBP1805571.1 hypothetical protein [Rubellimicrobium aerolatum]